MANVPTEKTRQITPMGSILRSHVDRLESTITKFDFSTFNALTKIGDGFFRYLIGETYFLVAILVVAFVVPFFISILGILVVLISLIWVIALASSSSTSSTTTTTATTVASSSTLSSFGVRFDDSFGNAGLLLVALGLDVTNLATIVALLVGVVDLGRVFSSREGGEERGVVACQLLQRHFRTHFVRVDVGGDH